MSKAYESLGSGSFSIVKYPDMSQIEDEVMHSLVRREREWWGRWPFCEYAICKNTQCRALQCIEEVHGLDESTDQHFSLEELEAKSSELPECPECHSTIELMYPHEKFIEELRNHFRKGVLGVLLIDNAGNVQGISNARIASIGDIFDYEFSLRKLANQSRGYDRAANFQALSEVIHVPYDSVAEVQAWCWNHVALNRSYQGFHSLKEMSSALYSIRPDAHEYPIIGETRADSLFRPFASVWGFTVFEQLGDEHGYYIGILEKCSDLVRKLSLTESEFRRLFGRKLAVLRAEQKQYIQSMKKQKQRKYYAEIPTT